MSTWFETIGVILIAIGSIGLGRYISGLRKSWWILGYLFSLGLITALILARYQNRLYFIEPFSWVTAGRGRFVIICISVSMGMTIPLSRLPHRLEKILVCLLMFVFITWFSILPFFAPILIKNRLSSIKTTLDSDGVCRQSTSYTCGPAAAVTALGKLGLSADEGELAVLSYSSPVIGTLPVCLTSALQSRYGSEGLKCQYRRFETIEQLKNTGVTLAVVKIAFLLDHCLAVLNVTDDIVTVADPLTGVRSMSREQFEKIWRYSGIVIERESI